MPIGLGSIIQGAVGLGQVLFSGKRKAEKKLENFTDSYKQNAGITDLYNKALSRYETNPYTSSLYKQQSQNINRNLSTGLNSLNSRRSANAGISSLVQGANDSGLKAAAGAEQAQAQALSQLSQATQIKAAEDFKPFEMKYNLLAQKASGANKTAAAGMQNIFGGISTYQNEQLVNKLYGTGGRKKTNGIMDFLPTTSGSRLPDNGLPMGGY